ncbi:MAG: hemolysin III family protein [Clostridiales bacterium]
MSKKNSSLSFGEEVANTVTHGVSALAILIALPIATISIYEKNNSIVDTLGVVIFCLSIFSMFLFSALYHSMAPETKHKDIFKILDHIFIYVAIAGTYTPIAISIIGGISAIIILLIQWNMVIFGVLYKSISKKSMPKISLLIYLIMGWTIIIFMPLLIKNANPPLFWLIFSGGVSYTLGSVFYALRGFKYHHMIWHIFVFIGALTHFIGIAFFL